ncbi:MAG: MBL fold metallo-hydrolase [Chloroflexota bacterium]|nr:MBL fold metallo-hydrolase [Chloroflexota bacterium]
MEIISNVHRIPGVSGVNAYLLSGKTLTLVDTGMPGSAKAILNYIENLNHAPTDVTHIVITHHHIDHIGSLAALKQQTQALVLAHPDDAPFINGERPQPAPRSTVLRLLFRLVPAMSRSEPVPVDVTIKEGSSLEILGGATVVHAPGHTPGSVALHLPVERLLFTGDAINHRGNRLGLPPKPFTRDMEQAIASMRHLAALDFESLCPGHGDPIVSGAAEQVRAMLQKLA